MISIDSGSSISIHDQIVKKIRQLIIAGALQQDEKLQSVRALSKHLVVNPNTVHKAYSTLERDGYLYSGEKKGFFVNKINKDLKNEEIKNQYKTLISSVEILLSYGVKKEELLNVINNLNKEG